MAWAPRARRGISLFLGHRVSNRSRGLARPSARSTPWRSRLIAVLVATSAFIATAPAGQAQADTRTGRELYAAACASCHGATGTGAALSQVGFSDPIPDFTDCVTASRETSQDWAAVVHGGGPVRAFSHRMPAFGEALSAEQIDRVVAYVRSLCRNRSWPRGELNLPRPMATEKAFPEDESAVTASAITQRGSREMATELIYEKRFGARNQIEIALPFARHEQADGAGWDAPHLGDVAIAFKRAVYHHAEHGTILSAQAELGIPTGQRSAGYGAGTMLIEPTVLFAQVLPLGWYLQTQTGVEFGADRARAETEALARFALGTTIAPGNGRAWSPMVELTGAKALVPGEEIEWDLIPQLQITLSRRQHIKISGGYRMPVTERAGRARELLAYLIWDWFDGSLFDGW
jgi:mono/diheme cytochrome c family protein